MVTLCKVRDCHVRITRELIKHFVWFENPQISLESVTTQQYYEKKIIFPLELIWFEDGEKLEMEKFRGHSVFIVNYTEAYSEDNTEDRIEDDSEDNNETDTEDVIKARDVAMSYTKTSNRTSEKQVWTQCQHYFNNLFFPEITMKPT